MTSVRYGVSFVFPFVLISCLLLAAERAVSFQASIPLMGLLAGALWQMTTGREALRAGERQTAFLFGAVSGAALYPTALGVGRVDVYEWGWGFGPLLAGVTLAAIALAALGNRFCWLLVLSVLAWEAHLFESTNLWDYVLDPVFALVGLGVVAGIDLDRIDRRKDRPGRYFKDGCWDGAREDRPRGGRGAGG